MRESRAQSPNSVVRRTAADTTSSRQGTTGTYARILNRPFGAPASSESLPNVKTLGYSRPSLRDKNRPFRVAVLAAPLFLLPLLSLTLTGCGTFDKPTAAKFASVVIEGHTPAQIRDAATRVFAEHGYKVITTKTNLICEKEASSTDNVVYGNWMGGEPVWLRVKITIVTLSDGIYRLQSLAFHVRDKGSFAFEEEVQVSKMSSRPYRKLFQEVAARLRGPPP